MTSRPVEDAPGLDSVFQQRILEHYRNPPFQGRLEDPSVSVQTRNPTCGDEVTLDLRLANGTIEQAAFEGEGCSISRASSSMMTSLLAGRTVDEGRALSDAFHRMVQGDAEAAADASLGDLRALAGVSRFPVRVRCALLPFEALAKALAEAGDGAGGGAGDTALGRRDER